MNESQPHLLPRRVSVSFLTRVCVEVRICSTYYRFFSMEISFFGIASSHFSNRHAVTMKFSALAALSLLFGPAAAEIYFKEDFNDEV